MRPASVSGIVTGDASVSYWPTLSPVPSNSFVSLCESLLGSVFLVGSKVANALAKGRGYRFSDVETS